MSVYPRLEQPPTVRYALGASERRHVCKVPHTHRPSLGKAHHDATSRLPRSLRETLTNLARLQAHRNTMGAIVSGTVGRKQVVHLPARLRGMGRVAAFGLTSVRMGRVGTQPPRTLLSAYRSRPQIRSAAARPSGTPFIEVCLARFRLGSPPVYKRSVIGSCWIQGNSLIDQFRAFAGELWQYGHSASPAGFCPSCRSTGRNAA